MATNWEHIDTFCPYCGSDCPEHPESGSAWCTECGNGCCPVPFEELEPHLQAEWEEEF
jgi:hypothetical protein